MAQITILLVPQDAHFLPSDKAISTAKSRARQYFPDAYEVKHYAWAAPTLRTTWDALERLNCPACQATVELFKLEREIDGTTWWTHLEDQLAPSKEAMNVKTVMPCCQKEVAAFDIDFGKNGAFTRFELCIIEPGDAYRTTDRQKAGLEKILGCTLKEMMKVWT